MSECIALTALASGARGAVVEIRAGRGLVRRLEALGIRVGQKIEKVSGPFMRGPVTVKVGNSRVAVGFGAASKVIVEPEGEGK
jgi:Fe2+ transport system protein FeoA